MPIHNANDLPAPIIYSYQTFNISTPYQKQSRARKRQFEKRMVYPIIYKQAFMYRLGVFSKKYYSQYLDQLKHKQRC